jgi:hypothetical protein
MKNCNFGRNILSLLAILAILTSVTSPTKCEQRGTVFGSSAIDNRIEKLTHAESVPRAVASVTPVNSLLQEPRSLPLAALIRRGAAWLTFQCDGR